MQNATIELNFRQFQPAIKHNNIIHSTIHSRLFFIIEKDCHTQPASATRAKEQ